MILADRPADALRPSPLTLNGRRLPPDEAAMISCSICGRTEAYCARIDNRASNGRTGKGTPKKWTDVPVNTVLREGEGR